MKKSVLLIVIVVLALAGVAVSAKILTGTNAQEATPAPPTQQTEQQPEQQAAAPAQAETTAPLTYSNAVFGEGLTGTRSLGDPNAPVRIDEFASLSCGHCASFHKNTFPELKEKYIDTGKVFFTFYDFPLNAPALEGAMITRCMPNERYFQFLSMLFSTQETWAFNQNYRDALRQNARLAGMDDAGFDSCLANNELKEGLIKVMQDKQIAHSIDSTPSFVINGTAVVKGAVPLVALEQAFAESAAPTTEEDDIAPAPEESTIEESAPAE